MLQLSIYSRLGIVFVSTMPQKQNKVDLKLWKAEIGAFNSFKSWFSKTPCSERLDIIWTKTVQSQMGPQFNVKLGEGRRRVTTQIIKVYFTTSLGLEINLVLQAKQVRSIQKFHLREKIVVSAFSLYLASQVN